MHLRRPRGQRPFSFPKEARLLERADFLKTKERGRGFVDGPLAVSWLPRPDGSARSRPLRLPSPNEIAGGSDQASAAGPGLAFARVGLTVSSKVGNSVVRNRVKRTLREAARHELSALPAVDLVLVARQSAKDASVAELRRWLKNAARRMQGGRGQPGGK